MQGTPGAFIEDESGIRPDESDQAMAARQKPKEKGKKTMEVKSNGIPEE